MRCPAFSAHHAWARAWASARSAKSSPAKKLFRTYCTIRSTRGLSCGWATRAGSVRNPRAWAYSSQPTVNLGFTESHWATIALMLSGMSTLNTPSNMRVSFVKTGTVRCVRRRRCRVARGVRRRSSGGRLGPCGGVVALALQGGAELDGGDEEGAGFADRLEVAVHLDGAGAVAVAEHAAVHLGAELAHLGAFGVGGQLAGLVVEGFDLLGDREVLVGDGLVGDAGVDHGHGQGSCGRAGRRSPPGSCRG